MHQEIEDNSHCQAPEDHHAEAVCQERLAPSSFNDGDLREWKEEQSEH